MVRPEYLASYATKVDIHRRRVGLFRWMQQP